MLAQWGTANSRLWFVHFQYSSCSLSPLWISQALPWFSAWMTTCEQANNEKYTFIFILLKLKCHFGGFPTLKPNVSQALRYSTTPFILNTKRLLCQAFVWVFTSRSINSNDYIHLGHMGEISHDSCACFYMHACAVQESMQDFFSVCLHKISLPTLCFGPRKLKSALFLWASS